MIIIGIFTHQSDVSIDSLDTPICTGHEKFRVHELLHGQHNAILDTQTDGGSVQRNRDETDEDVIEMANPPRVLYCFVGVFYL